MLYITCRGRGSDRPVIVNSETAAVLESLEGLFEGLTWSQAERWAKRFFEHYLHPKVPKLPKIHILRTTGRKKLADISK